MKKIKAVLASMVNRFRNRFILHGVANIAVTAEEKVKEFVVGAVTHVETTTLLVFSAFGFAGVIGELPFYLSLPMWIESAMVVPVLAVFAVLTLMKSSEFRATRRAHHA